ncbi:MAG: DUF5615 family PIN-like protein [Candidatus Binatia bacterium]
MIQLYADENVDDRIIRGLRLRGIDIITAVEAGMTGKADAEQLSYASLNSRVLLTSDQDFIEMHPRWIREGRQHAGIIYYSQYHVTVGTCIWGVKLVLDVLSPEEMQNHLEFIPT